MKNIMMFSLLAIFISCTVKDTKEDENGGEDKFPAFLESVFSLEGAEVLDNQHGMLTTAKVGEESFLQNASELNIYKHYESKSATTAIYKIDVGVGYIGLEITGTAGAEKLYLYKDGALSLWQEKGNVSFHEDNKVVSLAKGIFVTKLKTARPIFDSTFIKTKDNGDLHQGGVLTFKFVKVVETTEETGMDKAIYKKPATEEYMGIYVTLVSGEEYKANFYTADGTTTSYFTSDAVEFESDNLVPEELNTWETISPDAGLSTGKKSYPTMISDDAGNIYVSYANTGESKGFLQKYTKTTGAWSEIGQSTGAIQSSALAISEDGTIYWAYHLTSDTLLHVQKYTGSGSLIALGDGGSTAIAASKIVSGHFADIATYDNKVYIIGKNDVNGSSVYKYNDTDDAWDLHGPKEALPIVTSADGTTGVISGGTKKIAIDSTGRVYVVVHAFRDNWTPAPIYVRFLKDDNTWQPIGYSDTEASDGVASDGALTDKGRYPSIAIDNNDKVHISFRNGNLGNKATVKTWAKNETDYDNGAKWIALTPEVFGKDVRFLKVAFYSDGTPIVSFGGEPAEVYTHTGSAWEKVGVEDNISGTDAEYTALAVDFDDDTVYIAYSDFKDSYKLIIKKNTRITAR